MKNLIVLNKSKNTLFFIYNYKYIIIILFLSTFLYFISISWATTWNDSEIDNSKYFFSSLKNFSSMVSIINKNYSGQLNQEDLNLILFYSREALNDAKKVFDSVLEKSHPKLKYHFRNEYQSGLELFLKGYSTKDYSKAVEYSINGQKLLDKWGQWKNYHRKEIRIRSK